MLAPAQNSEECSVKIDGNLRSVQSGSVSEGQARSGKAGAAPAQPGSSGEQRVDLSPLGSQLAGIEASLADVPVVDTQRVDEIKQAISDGRFKVNADVIADRLLETVRELIRAQKG
jgi:negative regulator of flagellin synthesis FlgM